jgi:hypothetical protein
LKRPLIIALFASTLALLLAMLVSGGVSLLSSSTTASADELATEPHYRCYDISGDVHNPGVQVTVEDQFGHGDVTVGPAHWLCAPALKDGEGNLSAPHLKCYDVVDGHEPKTDVSLKTQFGTENEVQVGQAAELCVPVAKGAEGTPPDPPAAGLPHYQCYDISANGHTIGAEVGLEDQFHNTPAVPVTDAMEMCAPALKDGDGDLDAPHLKCYDISDLAQGPFGSVSLATQFGDEDPVDVDLAQRLCVPALKRAVVGGQAEYPDVGGSAPATADSSGGSSSFPYAALAGGLAAAAVVAIIGGTWYTRRRWIR